MAKDDLIQLEGKITNITGGGNYQVLLDSGNLVQAKLSGKMRKFKIRVIVGDKVAISVSPYDFSRGIISHRQK